MPGRPSAKRQKQLAKFNRQQKFLSLNHLLNNVENVKTTIMAKETAGPSTKVVSKIPARMSYVHVFVPTSMDPDDPKKKYSACLLISKKDVTLVKEIKQAIKNAAEAGKAKWGGKVPANLRNPLRDGDEEKSDDENYVGHYFINASSTNKPGIIGLEKDEAGQFVKLLSDDDFYSGCYARFSINFFAYNTAGNKGVGCGLNHLQKVRDGERLGGRASVDDDFSDDWQDTEDDSDDMMSF